MRNYAKKCKYFLLCYHKFLKTIFYETLKDLSRDVGQTVLKEMYKEFQKGIRKVQNKKCILGSLS